jgi:hypothetical protein
VIEKIELTIKPPTKNCFKFLCWEEGVENELIITFKNGNCLK